MMMKPVARIIDNGANACEGRVVIDWPKACWNTTIISLAIILAPLSYSHNALLLFVISTYLSLLLGHSVGMHRFMIHRTFTLPQWLEYGLIYMGVLVGMGGPSSIIKIHDIRDWAQRQSHCHDFFSHRKPYFIDLWWQLTSKFVFVNAPTIQIEAKFSEDRFYQFLEKTWRLQLVLLAIVFYLIGGLSFVVWGVLLRVAVSVIGHWTITYSCHNPGPGRWLVKNASVQAANIPGLGVISYGECWHNNHHAFPESARIGLDKGQVDPGWWVIRLLEQCGLAWDVGYPRPVADRDDLEVVHIKAEVDFSPPKY